MSIIVLYMKRFIKYAAVGVFGVFIDICFLYLFVDVFGIPVVRASMISFAIASIINYYLNKFWTFDFPRTISKKRFLRFVMIAIIGLWINSFVMYFWVHEIGIWYMYAKILASCTVFFWNYLGNRFWTFRPDKKIW